MSRYLVLDPTWVHAVGTAATAQHPAGAVIGFEGLPGVTLFPLDEGARIARRKVILTRSRDAREKDELQVRRFRAVLPLGARDALDGAMVEFEAFNAAQELAKRK